MADTTCMQLSKWQQRRKVACIFKIDDAAENKKLHKRCKIDNLKLGVGIKMQWTYQNKKHLVDHSFAYLANKGYAMICKVASQDVGSIMQGMLFNHDHVRWNNCSKYQLCHKNQV